jgi:hypothetical protein
MDAMNQFLSCLTADQHRIFTSLITPSLIQEYLDSIPYRVEDDNCCALSVFRDGKAHCFDGSLFAAAALRQIGYTPVVVQMLPQDDDDHMLAIYKRAGRFGCLAKSNFVGLRGREPVYSSIRELVMSYFNDYYNLDRIFSLRGYTLPIQLHQYDRHQWLTSDEGAQIIVRRLHEIRKVRLFTPEILSNMAPINEISYQAGMAITNLDGAYKPGVSAVKDYQL